MIGRMAKDSQVSDIIHTVTNLVEYIRGILSNFIRYGYDPETAKIRIGVTGAGVAPNYKIEEPSVRGTITVNSRTYDATMTPVSIFSGRNHRELTELDDCFTHGENWSTAYDSFSELKMLLSKLSQSDGIFRTH